MRLWKDYTRGVPYPASPVLCGEEQGVSPKTPLDPSVEPSKRRSLLCRHEPTLPLEFQGSDLCPNPVPSAPTRDSTSSHGPRPRVVCAIDPGLATSGVALVDTSRRLLWSSSLKLKKERQGIRLAMGMTAEEEAQSRIRTMWSTYYASLSRLPGACLVVTEAGGGPRADRRSLAAYGVLLGLMYALYPEAPVIPVTPGELRRLLKLKQNAAKKRMHDLVLPNFTLEEGCKYTEHEKDAMVLAEMGIRYLESLPK